MKVQRPNVLLNEGAGGPGPLSFWMSPKEGHKQSVFPSAGLGTAAYTCQIVKSCHVQVRVKWRV
jgi:hypothetical protein